MGISLVEFQYGDRIDGQNNRCHPADYPPQSQEIEQQENDAKRLAPVMFYKGSRFPITLEVYAIQKSLMAHALALWNHVPIRRISAGYFIAFPCMHIAQPLIVMWFLRRWKRMLIVLCAYDCLLIVSILLLEWHYVVDIIGGILVAGIAIAITAGATIDGDRSHCAEIQTPAPKGALISEDSRYR